MTDALARLIAGAVLAAAAGLASACGDLTPTAMDGDLFPITARTIEIRLSYDEFVRRAQVLGGYGNPSELTNGVVASGFGEGDEQLEARTLIRFGPYPTIANVRDTTGTTRPDSSLTLLSGRAVVRFDTTLVPPDAPVTLSAYSMTEAWHATTATYDHAVDTIGGRVPWEQPGGGVARMLGQAEWDPTESDSVAFAVDSMALATWGDTDNAARGLRVQMSTPGVRVRIRSAALILNATPSINPDTVVDVGTFAQDLTFIYDPVTAVPEGQLQIGGVPSWRTVFELDLPGTIDEPPDVCALVGCPFELTSDAVIFASVVLSTAPTGTAFRPIDTLFVDARPVFSPERLPKAPLGDPVQTPPQSVPPEVFGNGGGTTVAIPATAFVKDLLRGETSSGLPAPATLAFLSGIEPQSLELMRFLGAGSSAPPVLRILVTLTDGVGLP